MNARRTVRIVTGSASLCCLVVASVLLGELRFWAPPSVANFQTVTAFLGYFWWYNGLPGLVILATLVGAYLGVAYILAGTITVRSAKGFAMVSCLVFVNLFYAVIPGGLFYHLTFYIPLERALLSEFVSFVAWLPGGTSGLDLVGLGLLFAASILAHSIWRDMGPRWSFLRSLEVFAIGLLPLPLWVYLLDRREFGVHVADVQAGTALAGVTNADLLLGLCVLIPALMFADVRQMRVRGRAPSETLL
ncbi:MAG: hypothetical protein OK456_04205 [Thaumarchaeota archaeon]|nr:hypothetical protein [Nitrososphaerota archaeon]